MCPDNFDFKAITNFHAKLRTFKKTMYLSSLSFSELIVVDHFIDFECLNLGAKLKVRKHYNR